MYDYNKMQNLRNNKGQVLLIVIVAMAITLGVGLGITSRSTESLKRTGNLDSLQKVTAAAEGGLERFLLKSDSALDELANNPLFSETLEFSNGTTSIVTVSRLTAGSSGMVFEKIKPGESVVFLTSEFSSAISSAELVPVDACIKLNINPSNISYMLTVVTSNPSVQTFEPVEDPLDRANVKNKLNTNQYFLESYVYDNSINEFRVSSPSQEDCSSNYYKFKNSYMLRFQPLSSEVEKLTIETSTNSVRKVTQGFKLISKGSFLPDFSSDKTSRTIEAFKYLDTASPIFDYALYLDN